MKPNFLIICMTSFLFTACGGGGGHSDSTVVEAPVNVNTPPISVIDLSSDKILLTQVVELSGLKSLDKDGDTLSYQWTLISKPLNSKVATNFSNVARSSFVPDIEGQYVVSLIVSDGNSSHKTEKTITVEKNPNILALSFKPTLATYSSGLDKIVAVDDLNNVLNIIDRQTGEVQKITLSDKIQVLKLSPNGKFAIIIHPNHISYINVEKEQLLKVYPNEGPYTDAFITDNSIAYFVGKENGQWNDKPIVKINLISGQQEVQLIDKSGYFYSTIKGIYSEKNNQIFYTNFGSYPRDIYQISINPINGDAVTVSDSPYHGHYNIGGELFLNDQEDYIFTNVGTYFYSKNLNYGGQIKIDENQIIKSFVQDSVTSNLNILTVEKDLFTYEKEKKYLSTYSQYSDYGYGVVKNIAFPIINGLQSYGLNLFKDKEGQLFSIVQIGSAEPYTANLKYYVVK